MNYQCRHCSESLQNEVIDLGNQPFSNAYLNENDLKKPEITFPLKVFLCSKCWLLQVPAYEKPEVLFNEDYAYFSSTSTSWLRHASKFVDQAINRFNLNAKSNILEIASNDGYLLQYFNKKGINNIGIEPTKAAANEALKKGVKTIQRFFSANFAHELKASNPKYEKGFDLIILNNVLAHVPDINDFIKGLSIALKSDGKISIEFPHLYNLIKYCQFDTIYHEHFSYLSLNFLNRLANFANLKIFDVEELPTHGGSLRVWMCHHKYEYKINPSVNIILQKEQFFRLESLDRYINFQKKALTIKNSFLKFLINSYENNKKIIGYGAAAKGNTLLNYAGIKNDLISHIADKSISKQGKYMPGSHIPIISPEILNEMQFDKLLVLPWNIVKEVKNDFREKELITVMPEIKKW